MPARHNAARRPKNRASDKANGMAAAASADVRAPVANALADASSQAALGAAILLHALFVLSLRTGWLCPLFEDCTHHFGAGGDFFSIYGAGTRALHGQSVYVTTGHIEGIPYGYPFRYAPMVAYTLALGLNLVPALLAYRLWLLVCEMALLRNIYLTSERAPDPVTGRLAACMWLVFTPFFVELYVGQFTFIVASLVFWAFLGWQEAEADGKSEGARERSQLLRADLCWMAALWLKMMPALFLPVALLRGRARAALCGIAVLLVTGALYFLRFPADLRPFISLNLSTRPVPGAVDQGLMALLYCAVRGNRIGHALLRASAIVAVGAGIALLWRLAWKGRAAHAAPEPARQSEERSFERLLLYLYAGCSTAFLLVYQDVWEHHYVLLLPPLILLALRGEPMRVWLVPFLISALPCLFVLYDVHGLGFNEDPQFYWTRGPSLLQHCWKPTAALWLLGALTLRSLAAAFSRSSQAPQEASVRAGRGLPGLGGAAVRLLLGLVACLALLIFVRWTAAAISGQRRAQRTLVWPSSVFQPQHTIATCGPAALAAVCRHFGLAAEESEIAGLADTSARGTSMLGLRQAAREGARGGGLATDTRATATGAHPLHSLLPGGSLRRAYRRCGGSLLRRRSQPGPAHLEPRRPGGALDQQCADGWAGAAVDGPGSIARASTVPLPPVDTAGRAC